MKHVICLLLVLNSLNLQSQHDHQHVYNWDRTTDGAILGGAVLLWGTSNYLKQKADKITIEDIPMRIPENVWFLDKGATNNYSADADKWSDVILYTSIALPFSHYSAEICRREGYTIGAMALQTFFITDGITNLTKAFTKRFRPFTYNPDVPLEEKLSNGARYSFISGHASNTAALGWFSAKVFSDLYPDSKWKPVIWTLGVSLPAATAYLRYRAGKHFPTDVLAGYAVGAAVGYLVPHFHKTENRDIAIRLIPTGNGMAIGFSKRLY